MAIGDPLSLFLSGVYLAAWLVVAYWVLRLLGFLLVVVVRSIGKARFRKPGFRL